VHPTLKILLHCATNNFHPATTENIYLAAIYTKDLTLMVQIHVYLLGYDTTHPDNIRVKLGCTAYKIFLLDTVHTLHICKALSYTVTGTIPEETSVMKKGYMDPQEGT
jgi:hypothetical protein